MYKCPHVLYAEDQFWYPKSHYMDICFLSQDSYLDHYRREDFLQFIVWKLNTGRGAFMNYLEKSGKMIVTDNRNKRWQNINLYCVRLSWKWSTTTMGSLNLLPFSLSVKVQGSLIDNTDLYKVQLYKFWYKDHAKITHNWDALVWFMHELYIIHVFSHNRDVLCSSALIFFSNSNILHVQCSVTNFAPIPFAYCWSKFCVVFDGILQYSPVSMWIKIMKLPGYI